MFKDKPVNIHRVIALKKQFKQQVKDRMEMVTKVEQSAIDEEKSKYLKKDKKARKEEKLKHDKLLKKRKHKDSKSKKDNDGDNIQETVDDSDAKKKKRMSLYGL